MFPPAAVPWIVVCEFELPQTSGATLPPEIVLAPPLVIASVVTVTLNFYDLPCRAAERRLMRRCHHGASTSIANEKAAAIPAKIIRRACGEDCVGPCGGSNYRRNRATANELKLRETSAGHHVIARTTVQRQRAADAADRYTACRRHIVVGPALHNELLRHSACIAAACQGDRCRSGSRSWCGCRRGGGCRRGSWRRRRRDCDDCGAAVSVRHRGDHRRVGVREVNRRADVRARRVKDGPKAISERDCGTGDIGQINYVSHSEPVDQRR